MIKKICFGLFFLGNGTAFAAYVHLQGTEFLDGNTSIDYPCNSGGEPLVIYSAPINNSAPISSLVPIYPIYVKGGYSADNLTIDSANQTPDTSNKDLIVVDYNPGIHAVHFGLRRSDGTNFYVNTINFAAIDATATSHFVSSFNVTVNGKTFVETVTPQRMPNFVQDVNFWVMEPIKSITGSQYSWDQNRPWQSYDNMTRYPIPYRFTPQVAGSNGEYAGYGFWICGQDNPNVQPPTNSASKMGQMNQDSI
jgi:hypothetical protein